MDVNVHHGFNPKRGGILAKTNNPNEQKSDDSQSQ